MSLQDDGWIQTVSGRRFYALDPKPGDFDIHDIAVALARQPRFLGHTRDDQPLYSVAQHSVYVSQYCDPQDALCGLLHDGSESTINDVPRPFKQLPQFAFYRDIEAKIQKAIYRQFGLPEEEPASVKRADNLLLATEARDLMSPLDPDWKIQEKNGYPVLTWTIEAWDELTARRLFLERFHELYDVQTNQPRQLHAVAS